MRAGGDARREHGSFARCDPGAEPAPLASAARSNGLGKRRIGGAARSRSITREPPALHSRREARAYRLSPHISVVAEIQTLCLLPNTRLITEPTSEKLPQS